jgi:hypothetical protein
VTFIGTGAKAAGSIVVIMAALAIGLFVLRTDHGAAWLTTDRAAYQACYDFEREQVIENRAKRQTRFDE